MVGRGLDDIDSRGLDDGGYTSQAALFVIFTVTIPEAGRVDLLQQATQVWLWSRLASVVLTLA